MSHERALERLSRYSTNTDFSECIPAAIRDALKGRALTLNEHGQLYSAIAALAYRCLKIGEASAVERADHKAAVQARDEARRDLTRELIRMLEDGEV